MDELRLDDELGSIKIEEGVYPKGVYIWIKEFKFAANGSMIPHVAGIDLLHKQAEDLYAWLDLYLHEEN